MHCLSLCIGYGVGLKENTITRTVMDPLTKVKFKKREVVTTGGAFPEGTAVIRKLRSVNKYFASTQMRGLPQQGGLIDVDVRVASVVKLFQRSIVNYTAYQWYFQTFPDAKKIKKYFRVFLILTGN
ncbi:hypothetical protein JG688_00008205 [Phytophthora aleatoria]|uniref:Uncharacterized protein n=1 Tax=Phytophthora aleatoria TaxID=2496075 RepID=A0A8J5J8E2_9STRA|nr:hypothetical protein JG688_00008205 [Phytophthora aleatoria]